MQELHPNGSRCSAVMFLEAMLSTGGSYLSASLGTGHRAAAAAPRPARSCPEKPGSLCRQTQVSPLGSAGHVSDPENQSLQPSFEALGKDTALVVTS